MPWTIADEDEFGPHAPAAHEMLLPEEHIVGNPDRDLDETSLLGDLFDASRSSTLVTPSARSAADRIGRRASRTVRQIVDDPGAALSGAMQSALPWIDEIAGYAADSGSSMAPSYEQTRDAVRDYDRDAAERSPSAHMAGSVAGMVLPALATGGGSVAEEAAPSFLRTLGRGTAEGVGTGALYAAGASDNTGTQLAEDTVIGGLAGGAGGALVSGIPAASRSLRAGAPAVQEAADLARVASVGGGRGTISRTDPRIAEFARLPGGIAGQAARIRRLGLVGALESPEAVAERTSSVLERLLSDGAMTGTRRQIAERGTEMPLSFLTDALEREAVANEGRAARQPFAAPARELADRFRGAYGTADATTVLPEAGGTYRIAPERVQELDATLPYSRAVEELTDLSGEVPWGSDRLTASASRGRRAALRDGMDDWIEQQLGPEALADYREGRLDFQTARVAEQQAAERAARSAGNRAISLTDTIAASSASSLLGALGRLLANRVAGTFGPTGRATGREAIARLRRAMPAGTTHADLGALAGRLSPDVIDELRQAMRDRSGAEASTTPPTDDPFADLVAPEADDASADPFADLIEEETSP